MVERLGPEQRVVATLDDLRDVVRRNRERLRALQPPHVDRIVEIARRAQVDLEARLRALAPGRATAQRVRTLLAQVNDVVDEFGPEYGDQLGGEVEEIGREAAPIANEDLLAQLRVWEDEHPTAARAAVRLERVEGALRPGLLEHFTQSRLRYGDAAIAEMRNSLALSYLSDESVAQAAERMAGAVGIEEWRAERIVRTEQSNAFHLQWQEEVEADLGDQADEWRKQLVATFDTRTGEDSKSVNGQKRPLDGLFEDDKGRRYRQPPNRPNDRETVILVPADA